MADHGPKCVNESLDFRRIVKKAGTIRRAGLFVSYLIN